MKDENKIVKSQSGIAKHLGVSLSTVSMWIRSGKLNMKRDEAGVYYITVEELEKFYKDKLDMRFKKNRM